MMKPLIIALCGKKGVGKDTLFKAVADLGFQRLSFSDQLKDICSDVFPWLALDYPQGEKDRKQFQSKNGLMSPREVWMSMNVITEIDEDVLVRRLERQMNNMIAHDQRLIIITDLRKEEEYRWVRKNGIPIIRIHDFDQRNEDAVEAFLDTIVGDFDFYNYKNEQSLTNFQQLIQEILNDHSSINR